MNLRAHDLLAPGYTGWLGQVVPTVAASLGVELTGHVLTPLAPARQAVLVLIDGLGERQLRRSSGHAPFLCSLDAPVGSITCGFPSTTATSTTSLGTAMTPGVHGVTGWQSLDPARDVVFNHLSWDNGPEPVVWQPHPTAFERLVAAGAAVWRVGPGKFSASGLTRAGLRGGEFLGADDLSARVEATGAALRSLEGAPGLVYTYFGEVDRAGHVYGPDSWQWGAALEEVDEAVERIAEALPPGTGLSVVSDHGMVTAPPEHRWDLTHERGLSAQVRHYAGEPRAPQVFCEPGSAERVAQRWRDVLGEAAVVRTRSEAVEQGWFGPSVREDVLGRIGDVVAAMTHQATVVDSRVLRPAVLQLIGQHGSLTPEEVEVPLLHLTR